MDKTDAISKIKQCKIIPVIRTNSVAEAEKNIETLLSAGFNALEITMTIPNAINLIEKLSHELSDEILIGAGTVIDAKTAQKCVEAGAKFVVSPMFERETVEFCNRASITILPGALTPTEIFAAWEAGADMVKVFPVSAIGGVSYIKAVKSVFPQIPLLPTGGVNLKNAVDFFKAGADAVAIGSDLNNSTAEEISQFLR